MRCADADHQRDQPQCLANQRRRNGRDDYDDYGECRCIGLCRGGFRFYVRCHVRYFVGLVGLVRLFRLSVRQRDVDFGGIRVVG
jgi:hypothetical protein